MPLIGQEVKTHVRLCAWELCNKILVHRGSLLMRGRYATVVAGLTLRCQMDAKSPHTHPINRAIKKGCDNRVVGKPKWQMLIYTQHILQFPQILTRGSGGGSVLVKIRQERGQGGHWGADTNKLMEEDTRTHTYKCTHTHKHTPHHTHGIRHSQRRG